MTENQVRDIMTTEVTTIRPITPVPVIAKTMVENNLTGLPVVKKGIVVGIVTDSDLVAQKI